LSSTLSSDGTEIKYLCDHNGNLLSNLTYLGEDAHEYAPKLVEIRKDKKELG
jgi:hypothetical protein